MNNTLLSQTVVDMDLKKWRSILNKMLTTNANQ